jgi:hypothetical protein
MIETEVARLFRALRAAVAADEAAGDDQEGEAAERAREAALEALIAAPPSSMSDLALKIITVADIASAGEQLPNELAAAELLREAYRIAGVDGWT